MENKNIEVKMDQKNMVFNMRVMLNRKTKDFEHISKEIGKLIRYIEKEHNCACALLDISYDDRY